MNRVATDAEIRAAALELHQNNPSSMTISNVTDALGGGSRSTIGPILKEIRAAAKDVQTADSIPPVVRTKAEALLQALMAEAGSHAKEEFLARSARADADIAALEADGAAATSEIELLTHKVEEQSTALADCKRQLDLAAQRNNELEAALIAEKVSHAETQRMLTTAWGETNALRREQSHATAIGEQLESLNSIVAGLQASMPKRRAKRASRADTATPPLA